MRASRSSCEAGMSELYMMNNGLNNVCNNVTDRQSKYRDEITPTSSKNISIKALRNNTRSFRRRGTGEME